MTLVTVLLFSQTSGCFAVHSSRRSDTVGLPPARAGGAGPTPATADTQRTAGPGTTTVAAGARSRRHSAASHAAAPAGITSLL